MKINELYRDVIIQNYNKPFNKGLLFKKKPKGYNDFIISYSKNIFCNEFIKIQIFFEIDKILDIRYETEGCIILVSSSSLMSFFLKKTHLKLSLEKINNFLQMIQKKKFDSTLINKELYAFQNISSFPSKINCVSMPWLLSLKIINKYIKNKI
ncbi:nifU-like N terminal domain protein [Candidatus Phytoplasma oryzae]|uniref:NifU-like N terminal domain protein n=1 Tax=Candidatus Phytoplasma oryzae TaxID=203274 RepID=A0A139JQ76_9MOLU|nr:iron-sulfur cluster assembly scaffold protein [Candidatus Phytoplasma oryzae]KXT29121.1 nifU-like N terminal domain protein [Candidatus Phytoplasma oryzae]RAM57561.1 hypothetical protein DH96_02470 [Candidatus Phytoplasma oryzae]